MHELSYRQTRNQGDCQGIAARGQGDRKGRPYYNSSKRTRAIAARGQGDRKVDPTIIAARGQGDRKGRPYYT